MSKFNQMTTIQKIKTLLVLALAISFGYSGFSSASAASASKQLTSTTKNSALDEVTANGNAIASNPAAVNILTGTGNLQTFLEKKLGIQNNHGVRIGGTLIGDVNQLFSGGIPNADRSTLNGLFQLGLSVNTEKAIGWQGGLFDVEILQFNGQNTNAEAGSVQGYNGLPGSPPLNRFEVYKLWYRQQFFEKTFFVRVGKTVPSLDFDNVVRPVPLSEDRLLIPAVSGIIYTPLYVNTTMLGVMPGYYNSAYGLTLNYVPSRKWSVSYGVYDGNLAQGKQTGLTGPTFNGSYFHIAEANLNWLLGSNKFPGVIGLGLWHQTGLIQSSPTLTEHDASGIYLFGTQRLWYRNRSLDNAGISSFFQYGNTDSSVLNMKQYIGAGFTAFGLVPGRENDSMGIGGALSWLNQKSFHRRTEFMTQAYYQAQMMPSMYIEPALTYIPTPGALPQLRPAWAATLRAIILF